ncbi:MAG: bifunctional hydroxymethylpyrimidine kinase/phosphomethylpyrimidine kinase [Dokdonella sp.]
MTIAGSNSAGGAGIQADLRSFSALGVHGLCAITAVTTQKTHGVSDSETLSHGIVRAQINAVLDDFRVGAIKRGMLGTPALCRTIAEALEPHRGIPLIVDPVAHSDHGGVVFTRLPGRRHQAASDPACSLDDAECARSRTTDRPSIAQSQ